MKSTILDTVCGPTWLLHAQNTTLAWFLLYSTTHKHFTSATLCSLTLSLLHWCFLTNGILVNPTTLAHPALQRKLIAHCSTTTTTPPVQSCIHPLNYLLGSEKKSTPISASYSKIDDRTWLLERRSSSFEDFSFFKRVDLLTR